MSLLENEAPTEVAETTEVDTQPTDTPQVQEGTPEATYLYADGIAAEGEKPTWFKSEKYKTVADQAEAYTALESKFGSFTGSPKDGYEIEGVNFDENPLMATVRDWGEENQLSNEGLSELVAKVGALANQQQEEDKAAALEKLGERGNDRLKDLAAWGRNNLDADAYVQFQGLAQNAGQVEVLEKLIGMTKNSKLVDKREVEDVNTRETKSNDLKAMQLATNERGQRLMDTDPSYRAKVQKAMKEFYEN